MINQNILQTDLLIKKDLIQRIVNSLPGIFYLYQLVGDEFQLVGWNKNHEIALGYTSDELLHISVKKFFTTKGFETALEIINKIIDSGEANFESNILKKNGESVLYYLEGYRFEHEKVIYFMGVGVDVSSQQKVRINLEETKKEIEKATETLQRKERELLSFAIQVSENNEVIDLVNKKIGKLLDNGEEFVTKQDLKDLQKQLQLNFTNKNSWEIFKTRFSQIHNNFFHNLLTAYPTLTKSETKFCAYLKIDMSSDQIASILNISKEGIKKSRYRIRKKMSLPKADSLEAAISKL